MSILNELSTSVGDRTQDANRAVAKKVQANLSLLDEIAKGLTNSNKKLVGDCAEIFTMIAENQPDAVAPYVSQLIPLLKSKDKRIRWEVTHTLIFTARLIPDIMFSIMPELMSLISNDNSVIVRNYSIQALGEYATTGKKAAKSVFSYFTEIIEIWSGKYIHLVLEGLGKAAMRASSLESKACEIANFYKNHKKPRVKKAANAILKKFKKK